MTRKNSDNMFGSQNSALELHISSFCKHRVLHERSDLEVWV